MRPNSPQFSRLHIASCAVLAISFAGCGESLVDVRGKVLLDGQPLEGAAVTLIRDEGTGARPASGVSNAEGIVRFTTFQPLDGVFPGTYKVLVNKSPPSGEQSEGTNLDPRNPDDLKKILAMENAARVPSTRTILPREYLRAASTPLSCSISPGMSELELKLSSKLAD